MDVVNLSLSNPNLPQYCSLGVQLHPVTNQSVLIKYQEAMSESSHVGHSKESPTLCSQINPSSLAGVKLCFSALFHIPTIRKAV